MARYKPEDEVFYVPSYVNDPDHPDAKMGTVKHVKGLVVGDDEQAYLVDLGSEYPELVRGRSLVSRSS